MYSKVGQKWVPKPINDVFSGIPTPIDAVFFIDRRERMFFFKGYSFILTVQNFQY